MERTSGFTPASHSAHVVGCNRTQLLGLGRMVVSHDVCMQNLQSHVLSRREQCWGACHKHALCRFLSALCSKLCLDMLVHGCPELARGWLVIFLRANQLFQAAQVSHVPALGFFFFFNLRLHCWASLSVCIIVAFSIYKCGTTIMRLMQCGASRGGMEAEEMINLGMRLCRKKCV